MRNEISLRHGMELIIFWKHGLQEPDGCVARTRTANHTRKSVGRTEAITGFGEVGMDLQEIVNFLVGENYLLTGCPLMGAFALI